MWHFLYEGLAVISEIIALVYEKISMNKGMIEIRNKKIFELREKTKYSYKKIGEMFDISYARAYQIVKQMKNRKINI